jgi:hypothetical protein
LRITAHPPFLPPMPRVRRRRPRTKDSRNGDLD